LEGEAFASAGLPEPAYGCVFCVTGKELIAAQQIERAYGDVRAVVARQLKIMSSKGKENAREEITYEKILYPGYIFFEAPTDKDMFGRMQKDENIISVLSTGAGDWQLYGSDAKLVQWFFSYGGLLPFSEGYKDGDRIRIIKGPLKDLEKSIICVDKHRKNALVAITFCNREIKTWLKFELFEKI